MRLNQEEPPNRGRELVDQYQAGEIGYSEFKDSFNAWISGAFVSESGPKAKVTLKCKDPLVAGYYWETFGKMITDALPVWEIFNSAERAALEAGWTLMFIREARRQEHWDYVEVGDGLFVPQRRVLLYESDKKTPKPLVPVVEISFS